MPVLVRRAAGVGVGGVADAQRFPAIATAGKHTTQERAFGVAIVAHGFVLVPRYLGLAGSGQVARDEWGNYVREDEMLLGRALALRALLAAHPRRLPAVDAQIADVGGVANDGDDGRHNPGSPARRRWDAGSIEGHRDILG
jgi:hypothetical protein